MPHYGYNFSLPFFSICFFLFFSFCFVVVVVVVVPAVVKISYGWLFCSNFQFLAVFASYVQTMTINILVLYYNMLQYYYNMQNTCTQVQQCIKKLLEKNNLDAAMRLSYVQLLLRLYE